jgi:cytoskeletal protein RodZ
MATRRKRNLNFLPAEPRTEPAIDIGAYPVDIGVGELMRLTRERLGHELQSVANQLRIRLSYLEAIEDGRFRDLPGTTYAVGFVRSYADYLGLDGADIVRRFREEAARIHGQTKLVPPAFSAQGKIPRAGVLLVSAVGLAVLYGVWYYYSSIEDHRLPLTTEVPDRLVALIPAEPASGPDPVARVGPSVSESQGAPVLVPEASSATDGDSDVPPRPVRGTSIDSAAGAANAATPADLNEAEPAPTDSAIASVAEAGTTPTATAAPVPTVAAPEPAPVEPVEEPAAENVAAAAPVPDQIPAAPPLPAVEAPESAQVAALSAPSSPVVRGVVLEARMDSWIEVVDASGRKVFSQVLRAGERYEVPDQSGLILTTGNAGGLDVLVDGQKAPPLGGVGHVVRRITLEPSRLLEGTATPN